MSKGHEVVHRSMGGFFFGVGLLGIYLGLDAPEVQFEAMPWFDFMLATLLVVCGIFAAILGLAMLSFRRPPR